MVIWWRTFVSKLFATLLKNHKDYRDSVCGFITKSAVIKYHQLLSKVNWREITFWPVNNNSFLLYPTLIISLTILSLSCFFFTVRLHDGIAKITFQPVNNSFLLYPTLTANINILSLSCFFLTVRLHDSKLQKSHFDQLTTASSSSPP